MKMDAANAHTISLCRFMGFSLILLAEEKWGGGGQAAAPSEDAEVAARREEDAERFVHAGRLFGDRLPGVFPVEARGDTRLVHRRMRDLGVADRRMPAPDAQQELHRDAVALGLESGYDVAENVPAESEESAASIGHRPSGDGAHPERGGSVK